MRRLAFVIAVIAIIFSGFGSIQPSYAQGGNTTHTVEQGENLFRIALRYNTTVEALVAANNLPDASHIYVGQVLIIPNTSPQPVQPTATAVTPSDVSTPPPPPPSNNSSAAGPIIYTVQPNETLNMIAQRYGLTWVDLVNANHLVNANIITPGQQLIIPVNGTPTPVPTNTAVPPTTAPAAPTVIPNTQPTALAPANQAAAGATGTQYTVQPGEGLAAIGRKFNVSWPLIAEANNITDPNTIFPGMVLIIPTVVTNPTTMETSTGAPPGPQPTVPDGKYIKVVLHEQRVYVYQDGQLIRNVLVSTGLPGTPTVQGDFKIYVKYTAQLMTGPGYYLPGVPWVMYFYEGYGLHGTYWHHNWGHPMSHGCVNMPTDEAAWLYSWAEVGTPVHVEW